MSPRAENEANLVCIYSIYANTNKQVGTYNLEGNYNLELRLAICSSRPPSARRWARATTYSPEAIKQLMLTLVKNQMGQINPPDD